MTDQFGNPVPNVTVAWSDDANGTFASALEITDAFGLAQNVYTLGPNPGQENISVSVTTNNNLVLVTTLFETGQ